ncbi:MAG: TetR/AcrR family transcriptional regulator [Nevskia sp.]|nr:TetR/AcrR family transcriptional regulator [Nevskia sp.]
MPRDGSATRERLLEAGLKLAHTAALSSLRVDEVVDAAGVAKGTFYVHFPTREDFLLSLHSRFHDGLAQRIDLAVAGQARGMRRLLRGSLAYLDGCCEQRGIKAMLLGARAEPAIQQAVSHQNARFAALGAEDFRAADWPAPQQAARLWVGMVAEGAIAELDAGKKLPAVRQALRLFLGLPES